VQYGIAPSVLIPELLISQEVGEFWDCNEKRYGFVGPQVIHYDLDDLRRQKEQIRGVHSRGGGHIACMGRL
jgi:hypothetical protein